MDALRQELTKLEKSARYPGGPYPAGLVAVPFTLAGQGFFPGGDGLWRDDDPNALRCASPYAFPKNGIMFLGNDFGTLTSFEKLRGFENPPTWRFLKQRLHQAQIPGALGFYTNAYLGLRTDRDALAPAIDHPIYRQFCSEFLAIQIAYQAPRLIVTFGTRPADLLSAVLNTATLKPAVPQNVNHAGRNMIAFVANAPFSDLFKNVDARKAEGDSLAAAWAAASNA